MMHECLKSTAVPLILPVVTRVFQNVTASWMFYEYNIQIELEMVCTVSTQPPFFSMYFSHHCQNSFISSEV